MRKRSVPAFRAFVATVLMVVMLSRQATAINFGDLKIGNAIETTAEKQLTKSLDDTLPLDLDANNALPTVEAASLPGGPFSGRLLHPTVADLDKPMTPGDYIVPVTAFCTQYSIHRPGAGYAYTLGPMKGKDADAISALIFRGYTLRNMPPQRLQVLSWAIQSGLTYEKMSPDLRGMVDTLIPEFRDKLSGDFIEKSQSTYDRYRSVAGLPPFETMLQKLGSPGKSAIDALQMRQTFNQNATNTALRDQTLFAGQGTELPPIPQQDGPWTVVVPDVAFERVRIIQGNIGYNELQIRLLPTVAGATAPVITEGRFLSTGVSTVGEGVAVGGELPELLIAAPIAIAAQILILAMRGSPGDDDPCPKLTEQVQHAENELV